MCEKKVVCILKYTKEELSSSNLLWIYFLVSLGIALQVGAANWDIIWHGIVNVESFFTPPHTVLYSGVGLSLVSTLAGIILSLKYASQSTESILSIHHLRCLICFFQILWLTFVYDDIFETID